MILHHPFASITLAVGSSIRMIKNKVGSTCTIYQLHGNLVAWALYY